MDVKDAYKVLIDPTANDAQKEEAREYIYSKKPPIEQAIHEIEKNDKTTSIVEKWIGIYKPIASRDFLNEFESYQKRLFDGVVAVIRSASDSEAISVQRKVHAEHPVYFLVIFCLTTFISSIMWSRYFIHTENVPQILLRLNDFAHWIVPLVLFTAIWAVKQSGLRYITFLPILLRYNADGGRGVVIIAMIATDLWIYYKLRSLYNAMFEYNTASVNKFSMVTQSETELLRVKSRMIELEIYYSVGAKVLLLAIAWYASIFCNFDWAIFYCIALGQIGVILIRVWKL